MTSQIGVAQEVLDAIELRLIGADHRPWMLAAWYDENGRPYICKGSKKAHAKAEWKSLAWSGNKPTPGCDTFSVNASVGRDQSIKDAYADGPPPDCINKAEYLKSVALFRLCDQATTDMGEFVAHAPADIEILLNEVKSLRARLRRTEDEREEFRKEMLSLRVEKSTINEKLTTMRRTVREFAQLMKE